MKKLRRYQSCLRSHERVSLPKLLQVCGIGCIWCDRVFFAPEHRGSCMVGGERRSLEVELSLGFQVGCLRCCSDFVFLWAAVCCCREGKEQTEGKRISS